MEVQNSLEGEPRSSDAHVHDFFAPSLHRATMAMQQLAAVVGDGSADHVCADALAHQLQGASLHEPSYTERITRGMAQGRRAAAAGHAATPLRDTERRASNEYSLDGPGCSLDGASMCVASSRHHSSPCGKPNAVQLQRRAVWGVCRTR